METPVHSGGIEAESDHDLEQLLTIRLFERGLLDAFARGLLNGTTHTCIGQEHAAVAVGSLLRDGDFEFSNHRGHGHYLARFRDLAGLLAEIMGREGGVCRGVGGSQHVYRDRAYLSTGVQGEALPVAVGIALHFKRSGNSSLALVHVGDGTWGEGSMYEALNMAALWRVPVVVCVENNRISQTTPLELHMAGDVRGRCNAFGIRYHAVSAHTVSGMRAQLAPLFEISRQERTPLVVEFDVPRVGPHSKSDDTRPESVIADVQRRDWYALYKEQDPARFARIEEAISRQVTDIFRAVEAAPLSQWQP